MQNAETSTEHLVCREGAARWEHMLGEREGASAQVGRGRLFP